MFPNPGNYPAVFKTNVAYGNCPCGAPWVHHCDQRNCTWWQCARDPRAKYDLKKHRFWAPKTHVEGDEIYDGGVIVD